MSETLTPSAVIRVIFGGLALFVWGGAVGVVRPLITGEQGWTVTTAIGVPILVVMCTGAALGVVASWTNKVWIDRDANEIRQTTGWITHQVPLVAPTTVRLKHIPVAFGSTVSPTWTVLVERPGDATMRISTPWSGTSATYSLFFVRCWRPTRVWQRTTTPEGASCTRRRSLARSQTKAG